MINRHEEFTAVVVIAMLLLLSLILRLLLCHSHFPTFLALKHYGCYHAVIVVKFIVLYQFVFIEKLNYFPIQIPLPINL